jgi:hypothetical protein
VLQKVTKKAINGKKCNEKDLSVGERLKRTLKNQ